MLVLLNRGGGPERVVPAIEELSPCAFDALDAVSSYTERRALVRRHVHAADFPAWLWRAAFFRRIRIGSDLLGAATCSDISR